MKVLCWDFFTCSLEIMQGVIHQTEKKCIAITFVWKERKHGNPWSRDYLYQFLYFFQPVKDCQTSEFLMDKRVLYINNTIFIRWFSRQIKDCFHYSPLRWGVSREEDVLLCSQIMTLIWDRMLGYKGFCLIKCSSL